ncbi:TetR/AcrR family transcriptional regulator [Pseudanabaena sp. PCC 6802]|uniref:TetR/AcrR family transcriptional regulator n=1 Tax=Pseudanabaena sp. PCC 6802 TaxID=118173 RepID=UPI00034D8CF2|nr:TetR/AcrR family transcriptional regulator [Pseudanabaena sp. PCC 6802]
MSRQPAIARLDSLIEAATVVFIEKGYRRTQIADVAHAMQRSPGAIYRYVESKEALFDLVIRAVTQPEWEPTDLTLPIPTPESDATLAFLRDLLAREGRIHSLERAIAKKTVKHPRTELERIIRELYAKTARYRVGMKLVERSALDYPELAVLWFGEMRIRVLQQLTTYLQLRIEEGLLHPVPDYSATARLIVETVVFFSVHRHQDPFPTPMSDRIAEETVVDNLVNAYVKR